MRGGGPYPNSSDLIADVEKRVVAGDDFGKWVWTFFLCRARVPPTRYETGMKQGMKQGYETGYEPGV